MAEVSEDDVERLASRLALVVSEDGEAENAGRAMGQLARRLGLTGGQLKEIFMAGAAVGGPELGLAPPLRGDVGRLEREIAVLRKGLGESEARLRNIEQERDALLRDVIGMRNRLLQMRASSRSRRAMIVVVFVVVAIAGVISFTLPPGALQSVLGLTETPPAAPLPDVGGGVRRMAMVHADHTLVFRQPDRAAPIMATLPAGMPVVVRRLMWNMLMQWAEVEVGSGVGYVLTTDIDLS